MPFSARPAGWFTATGDPEDEFARAVQSVVFTPRQNASGQPAISLPVHWTDDPLPLPIGVTLTGRPADEATLLRLAAQLENAVGWATRSPAIWSR
jgi:amidase